MEPSNDYIPLVGTYKVTYNKEGNAKGAEDPSAPKWTFKVAHLVPSRLYHPDRLQKLKEDAIEFLLQHHTDDLQSGFLHPLIVSDYDAALNRFKFNYKPIHQQNWEDRNHYKITNESLTRMGPSTLTGKDLSALRLLPSLGTVWPIADQLKTLQQVSGPEAFLDLLELFAKMVAKYKSWTANEGSNLENDASQISQAVELGRKLNVAQITETIFKNDLKNPVTVPLGYYRGSYYVPFLVTFSGTKEALHVTTVVLDPYLGRKVKPFHQYVLTKPSEAQIASLLNNLIRFKVPLDAVASSKEEENIDTFQDLNTMAQGGSDKLDQAEGELHALQTAMWVLKKETELKIESLNELQERLNKIEPLLGLFFLPHRNKDEMTEEKKEYIQTVQRLHQQRQKTVERLRQKMGLSKAQFAPDKRDIGDVIHALIVDSGGLPQPLKYELNRQMKASPDQLRILFSWLNASDPHLSKTDLLLIETQLIFQVMQAFLEKSADRRRLTPDEELSALHIFKEVLGDLKKRYQKEFDDPHALENIWNFGEESLLQAMEKRINQSVQKAETAYIQSKELRLPKTEWKVPIDTKEPELPQMAAKKGETFVHSHQDRYLALQAAFKSEDAQGRADAVQSFGRLVNQLHAAYELGDLKQVEEGALALLETLPGPLEKKGGIWNQSSSEQLTTWSESIEHCSRLLWVAFLKQGEKFIWPKTAFLLLNTRAVLHQLAASQAAIAKKQLWDKYNNDPDFKNYVESLPNKGSVRNSNGITLYGIHNYIDTFVTVCQRANLTQSQMLNILYSNYTVDSEQPLYLLKQHPYFRFEQNKEVSGRVPLLAQFYEACLKNRKSVLFLDSFDALKMDEQIYGRREDRPLPTPDFEFYDTAACIIKLVQRANPQDPRRAQELWINGWQKKNGELPPEVALLRRQYAYMQMLLHPESTLFKGFAWGFTLLKDVERAQYMMKMRSEVSSEIEGYVNRLRKMGEKQLAEQRVEIYKMRDVDFVVGMDPENMDNPSVNIADPTVSGGHHVGYHSVGIRSLDYRNPTMHEIVLGPLDSIPRSFVQNQAGKVDFDERNAKLGDKKREQASEMVRPATEVTLYKEEEGAERSSDLSPAINFRLRTLVVEPNNTSYSPNTVYNVFDFLFDYPYLLENDAVQRTLEQALFRTDQLGPFFKEHTDYFIKANVHHRLEDEITRAVDGGRLASAAFLLQLCTALNRYAPLFPDSKMRVGPKQEPISAFFYSQIGNGDAGLKKALATTLLNEMKNNFNPAPEELVKLFELYAQIKNNGAETGNPTLQHELLEWASNKLLEYFNKVTPENSAVLTAIASEKPLVLKDFTSEWKQINPSVFRSTAGTEIFLDTGIVKRKVPNPGYQTVLPDAVLHHSDYKLLFGNRTQVVSKIASPAEKHDWNCYVLTRNGKDFELHYHPLTKRLLVYQVIDSVLYRFTHPKLKHPQGSEKVIGRYGIWINVRQPTHGLFLPVKPYEWKREDLYTVHIKNERVSSIFNPEGYIYNDVDGIVLRSFAFADPADVLLLQKHNGEFTLTIPSKKITLTKAKWNDSWAATGEYAGFKVIDQASRLRELAQIFGPHFHRYILPLEQTNKETQVVTSKLLVFPVGFKHEAKQGPAFLPSSEVIVDTQASASPDISPLAITIETARGDGDDGKIKTTAVGFFYLAYAASFNHDYTSAVRYLEKAFESPFLAKEKEAFELIVGYIRANADQSIRGRAFRLKAELAIKAVRRDKLAVKEFDPATWEKYLDEILKDSELYTLFAKDTDPLKGNRERKLKELGPLLQLSESERNEYTTLRQEAYDFLVEKMVSDLDKKLEVRPFLLKPFESTDIGAFINALYKSMKKPNEKEGLESLPVHTTREAFLSHFWTYYNQIIKEKIVSTDPRIIALKGLVVSHLNPEQAKFIDIGRQLLVTLALYNDKKQAIALETFTDDKAFLGAEQFQMFGRGADLMTGAQAHIFAKLNSLRGYEAKGQEESVKAMEQCLAPVVERHKFYLRGEQNSNEVSEVTKAFQTTREKIAAAIDPNSPQFSAEEKQYWKAVLQQIPANEDKKPQDIRNILRACVEKKEHVPARRHETETLSEITRLLPSVKSAVVKKEPFGELKAAFLDSLNHNEDQFRTLMTDHFAQESWKPSDVEIEKGTSRLKDLDVNEYEKHDGLAFIWLFARINQSTDPAELQKIIEEVRQGSIKRTFSHVYRSFANMGKAEAHEIEPVIKDQALLWYVSVAARCRLAQLDGVRISLPHRVTEFNIEHFKGEIRNNPAAFFKALDDAELRIVNQHALVKLEKVAKGVKENYQQSSSPMEEAENRRIRDAVDEKVEEKKQDIGRTLLDKVSYEAESGVLRAKSLPHVKKFIVAQHEEMTRKANAVKDTLLAGLHENRLFLQQKGRLNERLHTLLGVVKELRGADWEAEIIELALDLYKNNELRAPAAFNPGREEALHELEQNITEFLYYSTTLQQLKKGLSSIIVMETIKPAEQAADWEDQSRLLMRLLQGAGRKRYIQVHTQSLEEPIFSRKHLVAEYRTEMIARPFQPSTVKKLVSDPNMLILLPPGAGKSKWITPEAAHILAKEQQKFPVVLVTDELLDINRADLDRSTLELFKQAAHIFDFSRNTRKDAAYLADEYKRLLLVQKQEGYVVTTIGRLAALEDEIVIRGLELKDRYESFLELVQKGVPREQVEGAIKEMTDLQRQLHWLTKIRALFRESDPKAQSKQAVFLADEVDAIFDIRRDYNYSIEEKEGATRPVNKDICLTMDQIMSAVLLSNRVPEMFELEDKLLINKQSTLNASEKVDGKPVPKIDRYLQGIAKAIYRRDKAFGLNEEEWKQLRQLIGDKITFVNFVCGKSEQTPPALMGKREEEIRSSSLKYIAALKHFLSVTLATSLLQEANNDFGLSPDGCTVVPKREGQDIPNVRYGEEYENIAYHYIYYMSKLTSFEFFKEVWKKKEFDILDRNNPNAMWYGMYNVWMRREVPYEEATVAVRDLPPEQRLRAIHSFLLEPESKHLRLELLREDILPERLKVYRSQVKCNAQDVLHNVAISGASGTVNAYALPDSFKKDASVEKRAVMADTLLKLASQDPAGLNVAVGRISNPQESLKAESENMNTKFIIDQGAVTEGMTTLQIVESVRAHLKDKGIKRQILFVGLEKVNENTNVRRQMLWNPDDEKPVLFDRSKLSAKDCLVIFAPADIRGTDWPIPTGEGVLITGANTTDEQFIQAIWRARRLGQGQKVRFMLHEAVYDAAKNELGKPEISVADVLRGIKLRTLNSQASFNYAAALKKVQNPLPQEIKTVTHVPYITQEGSYFAPENYPQIVADIALTAHSMDAVKGFFVESKEVKFAPEFTPSKEVASVDALKDQCVAQDQLKVLYKRRVGEISDLLNRDFEVLVRSGILPLTFRPAGVQQRHERLLAAVNSYDVERELRRVEMKKQEHATHLKPTTNKAAGVGGSQEMVQEQAQQQQQQQQQVVALNVNLDRNKAPKKDKIPGSWQDWTNDRNVIETAVFQAVPEECGFSPDLLMTVNYSKLWKSRTQFNGELLGRLGVVDGKFVLIDNLDLDRGFAPAIAEKKQAIQVYSVPLQGSGVVLLAGDKVELDDSFYDKLVQAKLLAGYIRFNSAEETAALERWIKGNPKVDQFKAFLCRIHGVQALSQIKGWDLSPLKKLLS